jgi:hypothetical protein
LAGLVRSSSRSTAVSPAAAGKPRAAIAAGTSTSRSIHRCRCDTSTSGSLVSQLSGSLGPTWARTVLAIEACDAMTPQIARAVCSDPATALLTRIW